MHRRLGTTALILVTLLNCGCSSAPASSSHALTFSVDKGGFGVVGGDSYRNHNGIDILAATSATDLQGLTFGVGDTSVANRNCAEKASSGCGAWPTASLLVAVWASTACGTSSDIKTVVLTDGPSLHIDAVTRGTFCLGGGGTVAKPLFWVVAIPLKQLPHSLLRIIYQDMTDDGKPSTPPASTTVDLRPPLPSMSQASRGDEIRQALHDVGLEAARHGFATLGLTAVEIRRWPQDDLGCSTTHAAGGPEIPGYRIVLGDSGAQNQEFHWADKHAVYCGPVTP